MTNRRSLTSDHPGRTFVCLDLISQAAPCAVLVAARTAAMLEIAARHGVEYDGWACEVVQ